MRHSRRAFTLLELLAAIAIVAMIGLSLFTTIRIVAKARESSEAILEPQRSADLAFEMVRQDLENAQPPSGILSALFAGVDWQSMNGRPGDYFEFYTTAAGPMHESGDGEVRRVRYSVTTDPTSNTDEQMLIREVTHNLMASVAPPADVEVVLRNIAEFDVEYWDANQAIFVPNWDSTQQNNSVPMAIRIAIALERPVTANGQTEYVTKYFVRIVQLPCAVPAQNTSGLGTGR